MRYIDKDFAPMVNYNRQQLQKWASRKRAWVAFKGRLIVYVWVAVFVLLLCYLLAGANI